MESLYENTFISPLRVVAKMVLRFPFEIPYMPKANNPVKLSFSNSFIRAAGGTICLAQLRPLNHCAETKPAYLLFLSNTKVCV